MKLSIPILHCSDMYIRVFKSDGTILNKHGRFEEDVELPVEIEDVSGIIVEGKNPRGEVVKKKMLVDGILVPYEEGYEEECKNAPKIFEEVSQEIEESQNKPKESIEEKIEEAFEEAVEKVFEKLPKTIEEDSVKLEFDCDQNEDVDE